MLRANPRLCGYNLTGMLDHGITGEGVWTFWRELKPLAADTLRDGWAPLRWCLFVTPIHGYADRPIEVEAVLANEDVLPPGEYPVTFRITGVQGVVWERKDHVIIPQPSAGERGPLAVPVLKTEVQLDVPPGEYVFAAHLDRGGAPAGDRMSFTVSPAPVSRPEDARIRVTTWGLDDSLGRWLEEAGLQVRRLEDAPARSTEVILVGLPPESTRDQWVDLARRIARGSVAVFLQPGAYRYGDDTTFWLPLARKGECRQFHDWLYHKECVAKRHPIFDGLQTGGVLDWDYYDQVIGHAFFTGQDTPDEVVCAAFAPCSQCEIGYQSGVMIGSYQLGAGHFFLNTLNIVEQVDKHPAADRLLLNLVRHAHTRRQRRVVKLPADFNSRLNAELYPPPNTSSGTSVPKER